MTLDLDKSTWKRVKFGDVVKNINDYFSPETDGVLPYVAGPHIDPESMRVRAYGKTSDDNFPPTFKRKFQPGDVLLHSRGIEKIAATDCQGVTGEKLFVLRAIDSDLLDQRFLPILLRSPLAAEYLENHFTGSVNRFLNWKPLAAWEFDLPPLDQQKRIADLLWAVECHLNSLYESSIQQEEAYVAFRSSLLLGSYISPERDALSRPHAIPSTWRMVGISDLATVRAGATPLRREHSRYFDGGTIPWVKSLDLNEGTILETEERITDVAFKESSVVRVPAGTVLVAMYGGFKQIGRTGVLGVEGTTNQAVSAILNLRNDVRPAYLHEALKAGRNSWRLVAASTRKDPNITKKDVERFSFPLPPIDEQDEILAKLNSVRSLGKEIETERRTLLELRDSLTLSIFGDF